AISASMPPMVRSAAGAPAARGGSPSFSVKVPLAPIRRLPELLVTAVLAFGPRMRIVLLPLGRILSRTVSENLARLWLTGGKRPAKTAGARQDQTPPAPPPGPQPQTILFESNSLATLSEMARVSLRRWLVRTSWGAR